MAQALLASRLFFTANIKFTAHIFGSFLWIALVSAGRSSSQSPFVKHTQTSLLVSLIVFKLPLLTSALTKETLVEILNWKATKPHGPKSHGTVSDLDCDAVH